MKYEIRAMLRQNSGVIVNTASIVGLQGGPFGSAYSAAKHGVIGLTRSAALEYIGKGIRINAVCPSTVETEMLDSMDVNSEIARRNADAHPIGRRAQADEIATAVLSIASDEMSFMVAQAIGIDGGRTAGPTIPRSQIALARLLSQGAPFKSSFRTDHEGPATDVEGLIGQQPAAIAANSRGRVVRFMGTCARICGHIRGMESVNRTSAPSLAKSKAAARAMPISVTDANLRYQRGLASN